MFNSVVCLQVFLTVGSLGATHEEAHLRSWREVSEGKGVGGGVEGGEGASSAEK